MTCSSPPPRRPTRASLQAVRAAIAHRIGWLLCLVLLLPGAQTAAAWHALSHAAAAADTDLPGKGAPHLAHCDQCLCATPLGGGALPATAGAAPLAEARHALPQPGARACPHPVPAAAYLSRAPPLASL